MKYLILIHQNRGAREQFASFPPEVQAAGMQAYYDLNAELTRTGEMVSAEALSDDSTATVLSLRSGTVVTSDGPFAESKEMLAGFYLVDVTSLDRALEIAARIPEVQAGAGDVEVRAVMDTAAMA
ncbi:MAG TPA: YciI family protein [Propionicimonas sp.]|nr:YciI family protein [Propionicimonas sp.]